MIAPLAGGIIGLVAFACSLGFELLDPGNIDWLLHGDWGTHFLGWHLYRHGPWTLPLGATPLLAYPIGSSVALTDSIPVAAGLFKALGPVLPENFQYIGFWLLGCFVLQGVFGALLMQGATPKVSLQILGAALVILSPPLLFRVLHPALSTHWLLLAALWMYFRKPFDALSRRSFGGWTLIVGLASATHPYILMMVFLLMLAAYLRQAMLTPGRVLGVLGRVTALTGLCGLILWQCGYFLVGTTSDLQATGLGVYSMNLLSPLIPMGDSLLGDILPTDAAAGQYEGYAYMGAGVILLGLVAVFRQALALRELRRIDWKHLPFVLACLVLIVLALSPKVTVGSRTIFTYDDDWWGPLRLFRSSGRLFWPVYYAIVVGVLSTVCQLRYWLALVLMIGAIGLQVVDTTDHFRAARLHRTLGFNSPLRSAFWAVAPPHYKRLTLVPTSLCSPVAFLEARLFMLLAGYHRLAINAGAPARLDALKVQKYCAELGTQLRQGIVSHEELYVLSRDVAATFKNASAGTLACTTENGFSVCFAGPTYLAWQDAYDIHTGLWPPTADFVAFLADLDVEYQSGLHRAPLQAPGSAEQRARALVRYLGYRVRGCEHSEAQAKTMREMEGAKELRLCSQMSLVAGDMPPQNETYAFRKQLEEVQREGLALPRSMTHVDPVGEAVWLQEYARARVQGATHEAARDEVLKRVRSAR